TGSRSSTPATAIRNRLSTNADPGVSTATTAWPSGWSSTAARRTTAPTSTAERLGPPLFREPTPMPRSVVTAPTPPHQTSAICGHRTEAESPNRSFSLGAVTTNARRRRPNSDPTGAGTTQLGHASDQRALDTLPMTRQAPSPDPVVEATVQRRDHCARPSIQQLSPRYNYAAPIPLCVRSGIGDPYSYPAGSCETQAARRASAQPLTPLRSADTPVRAAWYRRSVVVSSWQLRNSGCMAGLSPSPDTPVLVPRIV